MSKTEKFTSLKEIVNHFRNYLDINNPNKKFILLFAHNGNGKTRLSMEFKEAGKVPDINGDLIPRDTLYFNAFTEDLFSWHNDIEYGEDRYLKLNMSSAFFNGLEGLELDAKIESFFHNYVDLNFNIDYENATVRFSRSIIVDSTEQTLENIKISRGEENLFIWCFFLAICQLVVDKHSSYSWVKYVYIDDPISSLDENNIIAIACDLANLLKTEGTEIKTLISTHHSLFFNVIFNEFGRKVKCKRYYMHYKEPSGYTLQETSDTPFYHHIATISELKRVVETNNIFTYHFNALRSILEKTASFLGYTEIRNCIHGLEDPVLFERALNLFSHGKYSLFEPQEMSDDNKDLFKRTFNGFLTKYEFQIHEIFNEIVPDETE